MTKGIEPWKQQYDSLQRAMRIGREAVSMGTAYLYRVGNTHFEAAFAGFVIQADDWRQLCSMALDFYAQSVASDDCLPRKEYPFNLARLYAEWHLGQWLMGEPSLQDLLEKSTNLYVEGLQEHNQQPLSFFSAFAVNYLLCDDKRHLDELWELLARHQSKREDFPRELAFWHDLSELYFDEQKLHPDKQQEFKSLFDVYISGIADRSSLSAKFYLSIAKIGNKGLGLSEALHLMVLNLVSADK